MSTGWSSTTTKNVRFCSHTMKRYLPCAILPTRNLASEMLPSRSEQGQHPVSSHSLTTRRWRQHPKRKRKERHRIQSSILHTREVGSEHEHEHTSTSEDDLLKLLGVTGDTQTWGSFRQESDNFSQHVILGTILEQRHGTTHDSSQNWPYRNLPSVRHIRTLSFHCSPVTPTQQLKQ